MFYEDVSFDATIDGKTMLRLSAFLKCFTYTKFSEVFAGVREMSGKVAVSGLVFFEKATTSTTAIEPKFTEKMRSSIAGKGLSVSTREFKRYKTEDEAYAATVRCAVTTTPWKADYSKAKPAMNLGAVTVYD